MAKYSSVGDGVRKLLSLPNQPPLQADENLAIFSSSRGPVQGFPVVYIARVNLARVAAISDWSHTL